MAVFEESCDYYEGSMQSKLFLNTSFWVRLRLHGVVDMLTSDLGLPTPFHVNTLSQIYGSCLLLVISGKIFLDCIDIVADAESFKKSNG